MLEKFTVIDLVRTRSDAVVTITGNAVKFNNQTAVELHHPSHIQFLILQKEKQFAIRVCKPDAPNAAKFCKGEGQKGQIRITAPSVVDLLRKMGGWGEDESWNIPGIYFAGGTGHRRLSAVVFPYDQEGRVWFAPYPALAFFIYAIRPMTVPPFTRSRRSTNHRPILFPVKAVLRSKNR